MTANAVTSAPYPDWLLSQVAELRRERRRSQWRRYNATDKGRARDARYSRSDLGAACAQRWNDSIRGQLYKMNWRNGGPALTRAWAAVRNDEHAYAEARERAEAIMREAILNGPHAALFAGLGLPSDTPLDQLCDAAVDAAMTGAVEAAMAKGDSE